MKRSHLVVLVLAFAAAFGSKPMTAQAEHDGYGAVAWSPATKRYGYSFNWGSLEQAKNHARAHCGMSDAQVVIWSRNGYIAIARGYNGATGWGYGDDAATARRHALNNCLRFSSYANIVVCVAARQ